ncbi:hypothetical protein V8D89_009036 [Ganoderma adspersum]
MKLDQRGDIAIAEVALYVPILLLTIVLVLRHGAAGNAGWIFFASLSIVRIVGGITHVLWEQNPSTTMLQTIFSVMESAGLSSLLIATLAFLSTVGQRTLENHAVMSMRTFRFLQLVGTGAVILAIVGGVSVSSAQNESDLSTAATLRHISGILFVVLYGGAVALTAFCWVHRAQVLTHRRKLLLAITASLPFLLVRVLFIFLSSFAPLPFAFDSVGNNVPVVSDSPLKAFSSTSGDWAVYLFMSVLVEYAAVLIYTFAGLRLPLKQDLVDFQKAGMQIGTASQESLPHNRYNAGPYGPAYYNA